jgi:hypothetical protein
MMVVRDKQMQYDDCNCKPHQESIDMSGKSFQTVRILAVET